MNLNLDLLTSCWVQQFFLFCIQISNKQSSIDGECVLHFEMGNKEIIHIRTNDVRFGHRIRECAILSHNYRFQINQWREETDDVAGFSLQSKNSSLLSFSSSLFLKFPFFLFTSSIFLRSLSLSFCVFLLYVLTLRLVLWKIQEKKRKSEVLCLLLPIFEKKNILFSMSICWVVISRVEGFVSADYERKF